MSIETIDTLVVEVTRECNLQCDHCLRGEAQEVEISNEILDKLFKDLSGVFIGHIVFTGGEPSLASDKIQYCIDKMKEYHVDLGSFYIATNCANIDANFIMACAKLYCMSQEKEGCRVNYSNDYYHNLNDDGVELLKVLSMASPKYPENNKAHPLVQQGRAKYDDGNDLLLSAIEVEKSEGCYSINSAEIYINCLGNVLPDCDLSYENQDVQKMILCNVSEENFQETLIKGIQRYNRWLKYHNIRKFGDVQVLLGLE